MISLVIWVNTSLIQNLVHNMNKNKKQNIPVILMFLGTALTLLYLLVEFSYLFPVWLGS